MDFSKLTAYIDGLEAQYGVPAADCIILKDHELVYRHMAGHSDHEKQIPLVGNEYYYLFSPPRLSASLLNFGPFRPGLPTPGSDFRVVSVYLNYLAATEYLPFVHRLRLPASP